MGWVAPEQTANSEGEDERTRRNRLPASIASSVPKGKSGRVAQGQFLPVLSTPLQASTFLHLVLEIHL